MPEMIDMHCHIIPGVDDGARTKKDVRELLLEEYKSGVRGIVMTPHYRKGMFEASDELVEKGAECVRQVIEELEIDMKVYLGCEYHVNSDMIKELAENKRFRMNGGKYVLIEFGVEDSFRKIRNCIYELVKEGFRPIIAHVERYSAIMEEEVLIRELIELGAQIQVDAGAILGEQGWKIKKISRKLLKNEQIHFIGSDAHDGKKRCPNLEQCHSYVTRKMGEQYAQELFFTNPQALLKSDKTGERK